MIGATRRLVLSQSSTYLCDRGDQRGRTQDRHQRIRAHRSNHHATRQDARSLRHRRDQRHRIARSAPLRVQIRQHSWAISGIGGDPFVILSERDPSKLPWEELGVDYVIEATGVFRRLAELEQYPEAGARRRPDRPNREARRDGCRAGYRLTSRREH
ncbi:MAG: hypothetical protein H8E63_07225 [Proteobacteria bacterium]|nr:hypothetical protein [Pseudomonadota bacterium]